MVADFWGVEIRGAGLRACAASTRLWRRVDSRQCTHESLKSTERGGSIAQLHGVMLKVELESDGPTWMLVKAEDGGDFSDDDIGA